MTEHVQGTDGVMCLVNLALLTGNLGKPGTGINPLRGQNKVQGSAQMGCEPGNLTGLTGIEEGRALFESVWKSPIPRTKGLNMLAMMDAASQGKLRALWAVGYDVLLTNPNAHVTRRALQSLDFVIVQDFFLNETAQEFGSVFLPVASSFEKDGTFMNAERRIQMLRKVIEPLGNSKPDWEIFCLMAQALGKREGFDFHSSEDIWKEVRTVWKEVQGISYQRIKHKGLQWPCPNLEHPGTEVLHGETFPIGKQAALRRIDYLPTEETVSEAFPFLLITGRTLHHFNSGTMTIRTGNKILRPGMPWTFPPKTPSDWA